MGTNCRKLSGELKKKCCTTRIIGLVEGARQGSRHIEALLLVALVEIFIGYTQKKNGCLSLYCLLV